MNDEKSVGQSVLVTGGAGFIGSSLVDRLIESQDDCVVTILDNFAPFYARSIKEHNIARSLATGRVRLVEGDITSEADVARAFDAARAGAGKSSEMVVVHLAACAGVRPSIERPAFYARTNVVGTQIMLDAAISAGVRRFIAASSSSVYGNNEKAPFSEEDDVSRPISPYAATKVATELICRTAAHLHDINITALRFFTVFGPRQRPDLAMNLFLRRVAAGEPISVFGDGTTSRDYTYIEDIVSGVISAMQRCGAVAKYRCYNLGGEHPMSLTDLVGAVEHVVGRKADIIRMSEQPGDVRRTWADLRRSKAELGYHPSVTAEEGLKREWEWLRKTAVEGE